MNQRISALEEAILGCKGNKRQDDQMVTDATLHRSSRSRRRGQRTKLVQHALSLAVLNMNGGRSERKWVTLERDVLHAGVGTMVLLLSETRLMNLEEPPALDGFAWYGSNRKG